jgi:hypothetical protein
MMLLSEAIILGSVGSKQGRGVNSMQYDSPTKCAWGSALLAVGYRRDNIGLYDCTRVWPWASTHVTPPIDIGHWYSSPKVEVYNIIWVLNDVYKWTRPQIAEWVASQERELSITQPITTEVACAIRQ